MKRSLLTNLCAFAVFFIISMYTISDLTPFGSATSPDSLAYLDMADNYRAGHGIVSSDFSLENINGQLFSKERFWPPLYPAMLSVFTSSSTDVAHTPLLSMILVSISAFLVFRILYPSIGFILSFLSSVLFCFTTPILTVFTYTWSESLFIPVLLCVIIFCIRYIQSPPSSNLINYSNLLYLVLSLVVLVYTRLIGIALFVLIPIVVFRKNNSDHIIKPLLFSTILYFVLVGFLLYSNFISSGFISGGQRLPSDKLFADNLLDLFSTGSFLLTPVFNSLYIYTFILLTSLGYSYFSCFKAKINAPVLLVKSICMILALVIIIYSTALLFLRTHTHFDAIDVRLTAPVFPLFWLLLLLSPLLISKRTMRFSLQFATTLILLILSINGFYQYKLSVTSWETYNTPGFQMSRNCLYNNFTYNPLNNPSYSFLKSLIGRNGCIVIDHPIIYRFLFHAVCYERPDSIDLGTLLTINSLPDSSILIMPKSVSIPLVLLNNESEPSFDYIDLGENYAVLLPVEVGVPDE